MGNWESQRRMTKWCLDGADHAKNIVETRDDLAEFNAILILSGDGLVFEVFHFSLIIVAQSKISWKFGHFV